MNMRRERQTRPLFIVAYEGATEWNYFESISRHYGMTCKKAGKPANSPATLLAQVLHNQKTYRRSQRTRPIIPVVILDIEVMGDTKIREICQFVDTALSQGVYVFINRPRIENWFNQHFETSSENIASNHLDDRLKRNLQLANMPTYKKPGSPAFFAALTTFTDNALTHCSASGHSIHGLPCMCQCVELLQSFR